jgi:hypothetical protein
MFDQQPEAQPVRQVRNHRTNSLIMIVSNRTFLEHLHTQYPAERFACVTPQRQREASCRRSDLQRIFEMLLAVLLVGGVITTAYIFWP